MVKIFIGYAHQDNQFVEKLAEDIEEYGIEFWCDLWKFQAGYSLRTKVEQGVNAGDCLFVVLSQHSINSKWVENEISMALLKELEGRKIFFLPLLIDNSEIPLRLKGKFFADFRSDYEKGIETIMDRIKFNHELDTFKVRQLKRYYKKVDEQLPLFARLFGGMIDAGAPVLESLEILFTYFPPPINDLIKKMHEDIKCKDSLAEALENIMKEVPTKRIQYLTLLFAVGESAGVLDTVMRNIDFNLIESGSLL